MSNYTYAWSTGPWSTCLANSCNYELRTVECVNVSSTIVPSPSVFNSFCTSAGLEAPANSQPCTCFTSSLDQTIINIIIAFSVFGVLALFYLCYRLRKSCVTSGTDKDTKVEKIKKKEKKATKKRNRDKGASGKYSMNDAVPDYNSGFARSMQPRHQPPGSVGPQRRELDNIEFAIPDLELQIEIADHEERKDLIATDVNPSVSAAPEGSQQRLQVHRSSGTNLGSSSMSSSRNGSNNSNGSGTSSLSGLRLVQLLSAEEKSALPTPSPNSGLGLSTFPPREPSPRDTESLANAIYNGQFRIDAGRNGKRAKTTPDGSSPMGSAPVSGLGSAMARSPMSSKRKKKRDKEKDKESSSRDSKDSKEKKKSKKKDKEKDGEKDRNKNQEEEESQPPGMMN